MKRILLTLLISLSMITAKGQDSLHYQYAYLDADVSNRILTVEYSNGFTEDLFEKLKLTKRVSHIQLIFKCFEYLNNNGYELVSYGEYTLTQIPADRRTGFVFKKKIP